MENDLTDYEFELLQFMSRMGPITFVKLKLFRKKTTRPILDKLIKLNYLRTYSNKWNEETFERL